MNITITKAFDFDAAHWLPRVADGHKCKRMHGHTYRVVLCLQGQIGENGMLVDYADIATAWEPIHAALDHRVLNEVDGLANPTTELLVHWIIKRLQEDSLLWCLHSVRVYESSTTFAEACV